MFTLNSVPRRERDGALLLMTKEFGLIPAIATGVRRLESKNAGHLDFPNLVLGSFVLKNNLFRLTSALAVFPYHSVRRAHLKLALWVKRFGEVFQPQPREFFPLFKDALDTLEAGRTVGFKTWFLFRFLSVSGLAPDLLTCASCQLPLNLSRAYLEGVDILCEKCAREKKNEVPLADLRQAVRIKKSSVPLAPPKFLFPYLKELLRYYEQ